MKVRSRVVEVTGPRGTLKRSFKHTQCDIRVSMSFDSLLFCCISSQSTSWRCASLRLFAKQQDIIYYSFCCKRGIMGLERYNGLLVRTQANLTQLLVVACEQHDGGGDLVWNVQAALLHPNCLCSCQEHDHWSDKGMNVCTSSGSSIVSRTPHTHPYLLFAAQWSLSF